MSRLTTHYATRRGGTHNVRIKGRTINIILAKIVYRCGVCLGPLQRVDFGLECRDKPDPDCAKKNFIHRDEAQRIEAARAVQVTEVSDYYDIVDGALVPREENEDA